MTDDEIIEVMAQSAYEAEAPHTAYMVGLSWTAFCKVHPNRAESFRINARASLAALRAHGLEVVPVEPTEAMVKAALRGNPHAWEHNLVTEDFSAIYRSMVKAAASRG